MWFPFILLACIALGNLLFDPKATGRWARLVRDGFDQGTPRQYQARRDRVRSLYRAIKRARA